ncbi:MAG: 3-oxoacid CoA-transferase subunit A [Bacilli bacterium]|nr:3-oxoacid CoA-transferase subunit A [Bacilli bacterium]
MKNKIIAKEEVKKLVRDGMTIMVGGFLAKGTSETVIDQIVAAGVKDLTIIANDGGTITTGVGKLIANNQVKTLYASHIGLNKMVGQKMEAGELEVVLIPQGSLAEAIRAGGAGLGGVLTPTGVGTIVEEDHRHVYKSIKLDGKKYLIEKPLHADLTVLRGFKVDTFGNVYYEKTSRNFNPMMAFAGDVVVVGADEIVEKGKLNPNDVVTPGVLVDYIVKEGE